MSPGVTHGTSRSLRVAAIGVATVPDGDDAHGLVVAQLVDDAVDADAEGPQAGEPSPQRVTRGSRSTARERYDTVTYRRLVGPHPGGDSVTEDPRVARSRAAVVEAALGLVGERGIAETSVDAIADRSGVAKTTIYRHWNSKAELILDALGTALSTPHDPNTGRLRADLHELLGGLGRALTDGPLARLLTTIMDAAERDPEFAELHRREVAGRHQVVRDVIVRGIGRGELPRDTDADEILSLLAGPLFYRRLISDGAVGDDFVQSVVDRVLRAYGEDRT